MTDWLPARALGPSTGRMRQQLPIPSLFLFSSFSLSFSHILTFSLPLPLSLLLLILFIALLVALRLPQLFFFYIFICMRVISLISIIFFSDLWTKSHTRIDDRCQHPLVVAHRDRTHDPLCTFFFLFVLFHSFRKEPFRYLGAIKEKEKREGGDSKNGGHNLPRLPARRG